MSFQEYSKILDEQKSLQTLSTVSPQSAEEKPSFEEKERRERCLQMAIQSTPKEMPDKNDALIERATCFYNFINNIKE